VTDTPSARVINAARKLVQTDAVPRTTAELLVDYYALVKAIAAYEASPIDSPDNRKTVHPPIHRPELDELIMQSRVACEAMSQEEQEALHKAQTESWVRGNIDQARVGTGGAATEQNRLVLTDDGTRILLTVYPASSRVPGHLFPPPLAVVLSPERAVSLCAELSEAAARHLGRRRAP
jgi:hypothetical protein